MDANLTISEEPPQWHSGPTFEISKVWGEPLMIVFILCCSMFMTRRRNVSIFGKRKTTGYHDSYLDTDSIDSDSAASADDLLLRHSNDNHSNNNDSDSSSDASISTTSLKNPSKRRKCFGFSIRTPNSSRFASHYHSRILQKFPFLIEMFYWIITYAFYRLTQVLADAIFTSSIIEVAQAHGLYLLELEQFSFLHFLFPYTELSVQQWFLLPDHQYLLSLLNHFYAFIHIPGTVAFIAWYYYSAPSHATFAIVRRTLTLTNLLAFVGFTLYPCMPPRLLPQEYGFLDSVHDGKATSIWMMGKFVNSLAAMPSMHFGYSVVIGCTLIHHSTLIPRRLEDGERSKNWFWKIFYATLGVLYPAMILIAIIATANHYWMDALAASVVAVMAWVSNRVFIALLPVEDLLLWVLRLEKPTPTCGERFRARRARY